MVTTEAMRNFALECLKWADETTNAGDRETMVRVAQMWMRAASAIDRQVLDGGQTVPDLRVTLD
jgi:hypothetical protein